MITRVLVNLVVEVFDFITVPRAQEGIHFVVLNLNKVEVLPSETNNKG